MLKRVIYAFREFGFDLTRLIKAPIGIIIYLQDLRKFRKLTPTRNMKISPVVQDFKDSAGKADGHYFWQDLICAQWIKQNPTGRHLDIGSRIDGFVAHLLSFMDVDYLDIRPLPVSIPGLNFIRGDAQESLRNLFEKYDSVSSLHAVEHFGLGRYSDTLDPEGHVIGLLNMSNCVRVGGSFYVSYPTGDNIIEFNSQRVLNPDWAIQILRTNFEVLEMLLIPWRGSPVRIADLNEIPSDSYGCAILIHFRRIC